MSRTCSLFLLPHTCSVLLLMGLLMGGGQGQHPPTTMAEKPPSQQCDESGGGPYHSDYLAREYRVTGTVSRGITDIKQMVEYVDKNICRGEWKRVALETEAELHYLQACVLCNQLTDFGSAKNKTNILTSGRVTVQEGMLLTTNNVLNGDNGEWENWNAAVLDGVAEELVLLNDATGEPELGSPFLEPGDYAVVMMGSYNMECAQDGKTYMKWALVSYKFSKQALDLTEYVICERTYDPIDPPSPTTTQPTTPTTTQPTTPTTTQPTSPTTTQPTTYTTTQPTTPTTTQPTTPTTTEPTTFTTTPTTTEPTNSTTTQPTTSTTTQPTTPTTTQPTTSTTNQSTTPTSTQSTTSTSTTSTITTTTQSSTATEDFTPFTPNNTDSSTNSTPEIKNDTTTTTTTTTTTSTTNTSTTTSSTTTTTTTTTTSPPDPSTKEPTTTTTTTPTTTTTTIIGGECCVFENPNELKPKKSDKETSTLCPGEVERVDCKEGYSGWIEVGCGVDEPGKLHYTSTCVAEWIGDVEDKVNSGNVSALDIAGEVKGLTEKEDSLTSNDLKELIGVLSDLTLLLDTQLSEVDETQREALATNYTSEFVAVVGNVITNTWAWSNTSKDKAGQLGSSLLGDLEYTGFVLAAQIISNTKTFTDPALDLTVYSYPREEVEEVSLSFPSASSPTHLRLPPIHTFLPTTEPTARLVGYLLRENSTAPFPGSISRNISNPLWKEVNSGIVSMSVSEPGQTVNLGADEVIMRLHHTDKEMGPAYRDLYRDQREGEIPTKVPGSARCVYWDQNASVWAPDGCQVVNTSRWVTFCSCSHFTMFAIITDVHGFVGRDPALDILGTCLTFLSCIASFVTFFILHNHKNDVSPQRTSITKQLCLSIGLSHLSIILLLDRDFLKQSENMCVASGVILHYLTLSGVTWMLVEGAHLLHTIHQFLSSAPLTPFYWVGGYGAPAVVVLVTLLMAYGKEGWVMQQAYAPEGSEYCWLSTEQGYIWAFTGPLVVMIVVNTVVMILSLRAAATLHVNRQKSRYQRAMLWVKGSFSLNCVLGVSWVFGLVYINAIHVFAYLFTIFNASQGMMLLVFNCLLNDNIRQSLKARLPSPLQRCCTSKDKGASKSRTTRSRANTTFAKSHNTRLNTYDNRSFSPDDHHSYQNPTCHHHNDQENHTNDHSKNYHNLYNNHNNPTLAALKRCFDERMQYDQFSPQHYEGGAAVVVVDHSEPTAGRKSQDENGPHTSRLRRMGRWWRGEGGHATPRPPTYHSTRITGVSRMTPPPHHRDRRAPSQWSAETLLSYMTDSPDTSLRSRSSESNTSFHSNKSTPHSSSIPPQSYLSTSRPSLPLDLSPPSPSSLTTYRSSLPLNVSSPSSSSFLVSHSPLPLSTSPPQPLTSLSTSRLSLPLSYPSPPPSSSLLSRSPSQSASPTNPSRRLSLPSLPPSPYHTKEGGERREERWKELEGEKRQREEWGGEERSWRKEMERGDRLKGEWRGAERSWRRETEGGGKLGEAWGEEERRRRRWREEIEERDREKGGLGGSTDPPTEKPQRFTPEFDTISEHDERSPRSENSMVFF